MIFFAVHITRTNLKFSDLGQQTSTLFIVSVLNVLQKASFLPLKKFDITESVRVWKGCSGMACYRAQTLGQTCVVWACLGYCSCSTCPTPRTSSLWLVTSTGCQWMSSRTSHLLWWASTWLELPFRLSDVVSWTGIGAPICIVVVVLSTDRSEPQH